MAHQWKILFCIGVLSVMAREAPSTLYQNLVERDDYRTSLVSARRVMVPTRAALDLAAWHHNALFGNPGGQASAWEAYRFSAEDLRALGWFARLEDRVAETRLNQDALRRPLSFAAVRREIQMRWQWSILAEIQASLSALGGMQATRLFVQAPRKTMRWNKKAAKPELWVEIELLPGTEMEGFEDRNGDGVREIYAQIHPQKLSAQPARELARWINEEYAVKVLSPSEVLEWAQALAGYWYPAWNTDLVWNLPRNKPWPYVPADSLYLKALGGKSVRYPTVVIRGNPMGVPHYTVIEIPGVPPLAQMGESPDGKKTDMPKRADRNMPENFARNMERWEQELSPYGDYGKWDSALAGLRGTLQRFVQSLPAGQMGIEGRDGWLFFRRSLSYSLSGDLAHQEAPFNPIPALSGFRSKLEDRETNLLFVPVPPKHEIYPEFLPAVDSSTAGSIVNPWGRKFLRDLQDNGLEVIDLLPLYLSERFNPGERLYQLRDTHWTKRGMLIAARAIADRVKQYAWYQELRPDTARFTLRDTVYVRLGDLVERLPLERQQAYQADTLPGTRVFVRDTVPYKADKRAPIILIGDSFTGVMELVDCKNGGLASHIARLTGLDVEVITSWGGGPHVRERLLKNRSRELLESARLVIYVMAARDLYAYPEGWSDSE